MVTWVPLCATSMCTTFPAVAAAAGAAGSWRMLHNVCLLLNGPISVSFASTAAHLYPPPLSPLIILGAMPRLQQDQTLLLLLACLAGTGMYAAVQHPPPSSPARAISYPSPFTTQQQVWTMPWQDPAVDPPYPPDISTPPPPGTLTLGAAALLGPGIAAAAAAGSSCCNWSACCLAMCCLSLSLCLNVRSQCGHCSSCPLLSMMAGPFEPPPPPDLHD